MLIKKKKEEEEKEEEVTYSQKNQVGWEILV